MVSKRPGFLKKIDNPRLFIAVLALFLLSLGALVFGIIQEKKGLIEDSQEDDIVREFGQEGEAVSSFFEEEFARSGDFGQEGEFGEDPFRQICGGISGEDLPVFSGFTACAY